MKARWAFIPVTLVSIIMLTILFIYNTKFETYEKYLTGNIACLLWLPFLYILIIEKKNLSDFGFSPVGSARGYRLIGILFLFALPLYIIASRMPNFQQYYPIQKQAAYDWGFFGYYELTYGMYLFCWEFFFRGFMLFGLSRYIGWFAIIPQAVAFGVMHIGKPGPEVFASFAAGLLLGIIALRAKSFIPCFVLHWASAFTFDLLIILAKRGILF